MKREMKISLLIFGNEFWKVGQTADWAKLTEHMFPNLESLPKIETDKHRSFTKDGRIEKNLHQPSSSSGV